MSAFLDQYDPLDVIGNGSFGIIRKVRRKTDGLIFARKELNFERMSERDRKQIVAEVNILKDLHHEHIVGYHDRYVDREAGILYILMEYCGGGDLSGVIKQAGKQNRPISEDTIWNYFMQILLALHHCHHPNGHGRSNSGSGSSLTEGEGGGSSRRPQILHRDLKPDNVFLDEANNVKLGDFGLSKALAQASFANTYVGTPYYMSPELMQEKAYDSKSDIWSLGCLIYELCALKPPFHEAKTHSELSILIRNGRIPPLPRGYSPALFGVIKAMLNLNPAMRPSAAQLLQHERLELVFRVAETEKMLSTLKTHKNAIVHRERDVAHREQGMARKEQEFAALIARKDQDIAHLQQLVAQLQHTPQMFQHEINAAVKHAVARREEELRVLVMKREEEVAMAITKREEEIMDAVRRREAEVCNAWVKREEEIRGEVEASIKAVEERVDWIGKKELELREEEARLAKLREELDGKARKWEESKGRQGKTPLEEVKNTVFSRRANHETPGNRRNRAPAPDLQATPKAQPSSSSSTAFPSHTLETPITRPSYTDTLPSAMKGVVWTATGEVVATPHPGEVESLFYRSPKVGLNFSKIFDFDESESPGRSSSDESPPPSPTTRKELERKEKASAAAKPPAPTTAPEDEDENPTVVVATVATQPTTQQPIPTRIRRPSIRTGHRRSGSLTGTSGSGESASSSGSSSISPTNSNASTIPSSVSAPSTVPSSSSSASSLSTAATTASSSSSTAGPSNHTQKLGKPLPHPHLPTITRSTSVPTNVMGNTRRLPSPEYDFSDQENLPSPFLKRVGMNANPNSRPTSSGSGSGSSAVSSASAASAPASLNASSAAPSSASTNGGGGSVRVAKKRPSTGNLLRAVAAANNAGRARKGSVSAEAVAVAEGTRPVLASARKASEEARKALSRP